MLSASNKKILTRVFSDAHVVDLDMSHWDKFIALWLFADHYRDWHDGCPLLVVDFIGVLDLHMQFNHEHIDLADYEHIQWGMYRSNILEQDGQITVSLSGQPSSPIVEIVCRDITVREASIAVLDTLQPDWGKPSSPLARRGMEALVRRLRMVRRKRNP